MICDSHQKPNCDNLQPAVTSASLSHAIILVFAFVVLNIECIRILFKVKVIIFDLFLTIIKDRLLY